MSVLGARVGVIMRTRNRPFLLDRALRDVLAQTFDDWHLWVVNDAGEPGPVDEVTSRYADAFAGRLTVLHRAESAGMEEAANAGLQASQGEFVCLHDDDDTWEPDFLRDTVAHLDAHPDEMAVVVRTDVVLEDVRDDAVVELGRHPFWDDVAPNSLSELLRVNRFVPISLLYRRAAHDTVGPFRTELPVVGDWDFHLRLASRFRIGLVPKLLAHWHQRPSATGPESNSITQEHAHDVYDLVVRDGYLRDYVSRNGAGGLLYLTRFLEGEFAELHRRLDELQGRVDAAEASTREIGLIALARRKFYQARHRLRRGDAEGAP